MKNKKRFRKILLFLGTAPFLFALGFCFAGSLLDSGGPLFGKLSFWDYIIFYSYLFWPTYVAGGILIALSVIKTKKNH